MHSHKILEALADLQVSRHQFVGQFGPAADDLEIALIAHQPLDQVIVDPKHDHHVRVCAAGFVNLVGVDDNELAGHQFMLASFQIDGRISVQYVDKFQGIMPMGRCVFPGCPIFHQDPVFGDIVVLKIDVVRHIGPSHLFVPNLPFQMGKRKNYQNEECCRNEPES